MSFVSIPGAYPKIFPFLSMRKVVGSAEMLYFEYTPPVSSNTTGNVYPFSSRNFITPSFSTSRVFLFSSESGFATPRNMTSS
jgi:hypothetical protein